LVTDLLKQELVMEKGVYIKDRRLLRIKFLQQNVNKEAFEKFFTEYKKKKFMGGDPTWASTVSPYAV
jgi:hypothetical protein